MMRGRLNTFDDWLAQVDSSGGPEACWPWRGHVMPNGYGAFRLAGRCATVHTWAKVFYNGEELHVAGMTRDHKCHNADVSCPGGTLCQHRQCCNPAHIETVPHGLNMQRALDRTGKCRAGLHEVTRDANGVRTGGHCHECRRVYAREYQRRYRARRRLRLAEASP